MLIQGYILNKICQVLNCFFILVQGYTFFLLQSIIQLRTICSLTENSALGLMHACIPSMALFHPHLQFQRCPGCMEPESSFTYQLIIQIRTDCFENFISKQLLISSHNFASRRIEEQGAILQVLPMPGMPSVTKSSGDSRLVSTCKSTTRNISQYKIINLRHPRIFTK